MHRVDSSDAQMETAMHNLAGTPAEVGLELSGGGEWPDHSLRSERSEAPESSNHDVPRVASRRDRAHARAAEMLPLKLRGTPARYCGSEIRMTDMAVLAEPGPLLCVPPPAGAAPRRADAGGWPPGPRRREGGVLASRYGPGGHQVLMVLNLGSPPAEPPSFPGGTGLLGTHPGRECTSVAGRIPLRGECGRDHTPGSTLGAAAADLHGCAYPRRAAAR